jgi:restriction endonuclease
MSYFISFVLANIYSLCTSSLISESLNKTIKTSLYSDTQNDKTVLSFGKALKKAVTTYNCTAHNSHNFLPILLNRANLDQSVITEVLRRLDAQAEGRDHNARYQVALVKNDRVRIEVGSLLNSIKLQQKGGSYKASHNNTYSREVFTVIKQDAQRFVTVVERPGEKFTRGVCLKVPSTARDLRDDAGDEEDDVDEDAGAEQPQKRKRISQTANLAVTRQLRSAKAL